MSDDDSRLRSGDAPRPTGDGRGVDHGPTWYRRRIRRWGPLLACLLPAILGALALLVREVFEGRARGWTSLILAVGAAPGLLAVGYPFATSSEYPVGIAVSAVVWLAVGFAASRVATRNPVASFADFWRANWWLTGAIFVGVGVALAIVAARGIALL